MGGNWSESGQGWTQFNMWPGCGEGASRAPCLGDLGLKVASDESVVWQAEIPCRQGSFL